MRKNTRQRVAYLSAINIATEPPHSPNRYVEIFNYLHQATPTIVGRFSNERLTLSSLEIKDNIISGAFTRYTYIDPNAPWWDSEERKNLVDPEGNPIPQVREGIGPNSKFIYFSFFLEKHILIIDLQNISIHQFHKALMGMLANQAIMEKFGKINSTVIPEQDALTKVLSLKKIERLTYKLTIPNPDVIAGLEDAFTKRMQTIKVGTSELTLVALEDGITPDDELKAELNIASRNGYAASSGRNERGERETRSTKEYPKKIRRTYPWILDRAAAIREISKNIFRVF